jgi:F0F1-type ATP synthase assembly protein I
MQETEFSEPSNMKHYVEALGLGFTIACIIGLSTLAGFYLDILFKTNPLMICLGIIFGTGGAFIYLYQISKRK